MQLGSDGHSHAWQECLSCDHPWYSFSAFRANLQLRGEVRKVPAASFRGGDTRKVQQGRCWLLALLGKGVLWGGLLAYWPRVREVMCRTGLETVELPSLEWRRGCASMFWEMGLIACLAYIGDHPHIPRLQFILKAE